MYHPLSREVAGLHVDNLLRASIEAEVLKSIKAAGGSKAPGPRERFRRLFLPRPTAVHPA
jgi:hypothetical protein